MNIYASFLHYYIRKWYECVCIVIASFICFLQKEERESSGRKEYVSHTAKTMFAFTQHTHIWWATIADDMTKGTTEILIQFRMASLEP